MIRRFCAVLLLLLCTVPARAERLKDLASLGGARPNQLMGYGLVVGLSNTGDDFYAGIGMQSVATMLRHLGVNVDPNNLRLRNVAAVMVTADLPAYVTPGQRLDVTVSSIGNARSLEGGTLIATPLKGADMKVYAVSQGPLSVGGFYAGGISYTRLMKNVTTVGRVPNGALVEREVKVQLPQDGLHIALRSPDFTTAVRIANAIEMRVAALAPPPPPPPEEPTAADPNAAAADPNAAAADPNTAAAKANEPPERWATARDAGTVVVRLPLSYLNNIAAFMAELETLDIQPDLPNRVIINERTGTVVLGDSVRLSPVAIAHGGLTLEVKEQPLVSQPAPFSQNGQTVVVPQTQVNAFESKAQMHALSPGANLGEVVKALNTLGVSPRDLVAILQALKSAGALRADLEIQ